MNIPNVKLGLVAVSRDCFPAELSRRRRDAVKSAYGGELFAAETIVENERNALTALDELKAAGVNALCVYWGNFGPETPETILAQRFDGSVMFAAAAKETAENLIDGRGDAYCGMLNASYNLGLRGVRAYIPEYPVGLASEVAAMIAEFIPIARTARTENFCVRTAPAGFFACNAPIKPLYDLGVEIQENSELDLFAAYRAHADDERIRQ